MDIATQEEATRLLKEGARLLYTSAAGQPVQIGDVNAWFEQYNRLVGPLELGDTFGAIVERQAESDPLVDRAEALLAELVTRTTMARDEFAVMVAAARQGEA